MKTLKFNLVMIAVVVGAIGAFAFKPANHKVQTDEYWFEYNAAGTQIIDPTTMPPNQIADPFGCSGSTTNCAVSYTSTNFVNGHYVPAGTQVQLDQKD